MILVALNLRPALSSLAPMLLRIQQSTGLSELAIGALTTLPVLCLGLFAPMAPRLTQRLGAERTLSLALLLLGVALLVRASADPWRLYLGTLMAGAAIGIAGTLLPALVKRELPDQADLLTGVYTMALCLGAALAAGFSVPIADAFGDWRIGLGIWALLAFVALLVWYWRMPHPWPETTSSTSQLVPVKLGRSSLAWHVTLFMGSQSSLAYIVFGWLPVLLQRRGLSEAESGWLLAISLMAQLVTALGAPWLARLGNDQRPAIWLMLFATGTGLLSLLLAPLEWRWASAVLLGLGQGGSFSMALSLIVLRTANSRLAGELSGMAQGFGYCLAALGPLAVGVLLHYTDSLNVMAMLFATIIVVSAFFGGLAGRDRRLDTDTEGHLVIRR
ncbi:CynX/NimT family MFS transporter [Halomonas shantousis]